MSLQPGAFQDGQSVEITIEYAHSTMVVVSTNCPFVDHFLRKVKMCQARNTWINYAHDLKIFFSVLNQPLEQIDRRSCLRFMEIQDQGGLSSLTINRRLAAVSSLFIELNLLDPVAFPENPVIPVQRDQTGVSVAKASTANNPTVSLMSSPKRTCRRFLPFSLPGGIARSSCSCGSIV